MVFEDIRRCDEHDDVDFSDETELLKFVRKNRWVSVNIGSLRLIRINVRLFHFPYQILPHPGFPKKTRPASPPARSDRSVSQRLSTPLSPASA